MDQTNHLQRQESAWEVIKETVIMLVQVIYYWLVAIVKAVLPASIQGKDVSGETVLITGAGEFIFIFLNLSSKCLFCWLMSLSTSFHLCQDSDATSVLLKISS